MALFKRRNRDSSILPEEVRDYYQAESRQRTGAAWLLAAATLILTILIAAVLFLGGRWVYRTVFDRNDNKPTTTVQSVNDKKEEAKTPATTPANNPQSSTSNTSRTPSTSTNTRSTTTPATTPDTGPSELVDTGPGDEL